MSDDGITADQPHKPPPHTADPTEEAPAAAPPTAEAPTAAPPTAEAPPGLRDSFTVVHPPHLDMRRGGKGWSAEVAARLKVDVVHTWFLYISIPCTVGVLVLCIALYVSSDVKAITASHAVSGVCALGAVGLTVFLVYSHLTAWSSAMEQRLTCRILFMAPIYAVDSWVALVVYKQGNLVAVVRDTYEGYVIYAFFRLLMSYLGGEEMLLREWETSGTMVEHMPPFNRCIKSFKPTRKTLWLWKLCLMQYVLINPLLTLITVPLYITGNYHEGEFGPKEVYTYFAAIRFISVTFAFTSLVYCFMSTQKFIPQRKPLYKFAAIKAVVFVSFWQSVLLAGLNHYHVIPHTDLWTSEDVTTGLQNFLICIEMYIAALAHRWIFSDAPYMPADGRSTLAWWKVKYLFSIEDMVQDAQSLLRPSEYGTLSTGLIGAQEMPHVQD